MKRILALTIVLLVVVFLSTSAFATTGSTSIWLKNPFMRLWYAVHTLQDRITSITLTPGPQGPQGPQGPAGECGYTNSSSTEIQSLAERIAQLENYQLPDCILDSDCYDNNECTNDACDPLQGCTYTNNHNACDDGNPDTINDYCNNGICTGQTSNGTGGGSSNGELVITEIMYNPDVVTDAEGEWFEIYNKGSTAVNLNGWSIEGYSSDYYTIQEDYTITPGEYAVLCKNMDSSTNGGITCDLQYTSFTLGNTYDTITILNPNGGLVDSVEYNTSAEPWKSLNKAGYTLQLDPSHYTVIENDDGAYWCNAYEPLPLGDYATPGTINSDCQ